MSNCIRLTLNIKDESINFKKDYLTEELINGIQTLVFSGIHNPKVPKSCPKCGTVNEDYSIIKNGTKIISIKLPKISNRLAILRLKKQRFLCRSCNRSFISTTTIVKFNHSISVNTMLSALIELKGKSSVKDISERHNISHTTLHNYLRELGSEFIADKTFLPPHLCFDEFKSVKGIDAYMSFICTDSKGRIIDIVQNRLLSHLKSYFFSYTKEARDNVRTICIDMYSPYIELIRSCFPKAEIITDRFHVIQLISRSLNRTRIKVMKEHPKMQNKLKKYWKLILKSNDDLDTENHRRFKCFNYHMTEAQVVSELLRIDDELEATYWYYQEFLRNFRKRNIERCKELIHNPNKDLSETMLITIKTFKEQEKYIVNSMRYSYSNGVIEGTNNLIKVLKRIAFGYRSYDNFRNRILLVANSLIVLDQTKKRLH